VSKPLEVKPATAEPVAVDQAPSSTPSCHSFDPNTPVLLADGTTKPIKDVKVEDQVLATDPTTGQTRARSVTELHSNTDADLADITVQATDGSTATIHTTQHHPFWNQSQHTWTDARDITPNATKLLTADGKEDTVVAVRTYTGSKQMRDLTVDITHTYYVVVGDTPVLVHNCNTPQPPIAVVDHLQNLGTPSKVVVIGRTMDRVNAAADELRSLGVDNVLTYKPWSNDPFDAALALRRNTRWIQDKMREGYHIVDIGPDLSRTDPFGPFYGMESGMTDGYSNVHHMIWPSS